MASAGESTPKDLFTEPELERALGVISALSSTIGPRPPCSAEEELAAEVISAELELAGLNPRTESFPSARSFGPSYLTVFGLAIFGALIERRSRNVGALSGIAAAGLGIGESRFAFETPLRLLKNRRSQNVWAVVEPREAHTRTVCLVSHMDSSRSGLMFHPAVTPKLGNAVACTGAAVIVQALAPLLRRVPFGTGVVRMARGLIVAGFGLVLERELRGEDVPGANDNASGVAACLSLAAFFSREPLENTKVVVLVTGSEESGLFGMREFLRGQDTDGWLFINFDGVGADAPLRVLSKEGGPLSALKADQWLLKLADEVGEDHPGLRAEPLANGSGLPYDSTPVIAAGGRAITIVNQDGAIPDYHWPTDVADRLSPAAFRRAVEFGARLVLRIDRASTGRPAGAGQQMPV